MSGECKSYRLNEPMKWAEFRGMPEDIQVAYIKLLREKWNTPNCAIATMMGIDKGLLSRHLTTLGFAKLPTGRRDWDKDGFAEWCYGVPKQEEVEPEIPVEVEQEIVEEEIPVKEECPFVQIPNPGIKVNLINAEEELKQEEESRFKKTVPTTGSMTYEGNTFNILSSLADLLGNTKVLLSVKWDVVEE